MKTICKHLSNGVCMNCLFHYEAKLEIEYKKQGALEELRKVWSLSNAEAWNYIKKRIRELKQ